MIDPNIKKVMIAMAFGVSIFDLYQGPVNDINLYMDWAVIAITLIWLALGGWNEK